jgi:hypothetical protein
MSLNRSHRPLRRCLKVQGYSFSPNHSPRISVNPVGRDDPAPRVPVILSAAKNLTLVPRPSSLRATARVAPAFLAANPYPHPHQPRRGGALLRPSPRRAYLPSCHSERSEESRPRPSWFPPRGIAAVVGTKNMPPACFLNVPTRSGGGGIHPRPPQDVSPAGCIPRPCKNCRQICFFKHICSNPELYDVKSYKFRQIRREWKCSRI